MTTQSILHTNDVVNNADVLLLAGVELCQQLPSVLFHEAHELHVLQRGGVGDVFVHVVHADLSERHVVLLDEQTAEEAEQRPRCDG